MRIDSIAGVAYDRLVRRIVRRAAFMLAILLCALVAVYQFTVAGFLVVRSITELSRRIYSLAPYTLRSPLSVLQQSGQCAVVHQAQPRLPRLQASAKCNSSCSSKR